MASISSSAVVYDRPQADGTRWVRVKFVAEDHNSAQRDVFVGPRQVAAGFDVNAWMEAYEDDVLERMAQEEDDGGLDVSAVANPLTYAQNPKWSTTKRIAKAMIYWMMKDRDVRIVLYLQPLIEYIQANYSATQIANLLDITVAQVGRLNRRVNAVLTDTGTLSTLLSDFDTEEDEF